MSIPKLTPSVVLQQWLDQFQEKLSLSGSKLETSEAINAVIGSEFIAQYFLRSTDRLLAALADNSFHRPWNLDDYQHYLSEQLDCQSDFKSFQQQLRQARHLAMIRIAWRDLNQQAELSESLNELSWLAEACTQHASHYAQQQLQADYGIAQSESGRTLDLIVIGMGKLGAWELNFSSDIDLIFCFARNGQTQGGRRSESHSEYFARWARLLISLLGDNTADGFVFRVDARLRPFGNSGQMALSFDAMEAYYERHGREWERYAMVKARVIAGHPVDGDELMERLHPFVYRRYLDFSAYESLRDMKAMVEQEVIKKGMANNIKLGPDGIREIEFITQAFQLIRGGREPQLQDRRLMKVLPALAKMKILPDYVVSELLDAYTFLRRSENHIQAYLDKQTHDLPQQDLVQQRLAYSMGFALWDEFIAQLNEHRQNVRNHFHQVFSAPQLDKNDNENPIVTSFNLLWQDKLTDDEALEVLSLQGFKHAKDVLLALSTLKKSASFRAISRNGRNRLDQLIPMLLGAASHQAHADLSFLRIINIIEKLARRTVYLTMLIEHPMVLSQLVRLCGKSAWISEQLQRHPLLLDELLDPRQLYQPPNRMDLEQELDHKLQHLNWDDTEVQMDNLRQFKLANALRAAASQLSGALPVERVSDQLSFIAETVIEKSLSLVQAQMASRHGKAKYHLNDRTCEAGFCVIAYGKLGGLELGFGSDLDVVFLHDSQGQQQITDGKKSLDNAQFFARLAQRLIHFLNTPTSAGVLYEVDTRLRPSGGSGLLVSNIEAFEKYQREKAWVWEHQAIVRARPVAGSVHIAQRFNDIRKNILCQKRDETVLRQEVAGMRERMRNELSKDKDDQFDLKQGRGGITDIEFMTQYLVLAWAHQHPELTDWTDNLRQLETLTKLKLLNADDAKILLQAYLAYRAKAHELSLQNQAAISFSGEFDEFRALVCRLWQSIMV